MSKICQCVPFGHYTALINQKNGPKDNANLSSRRCLNGSPPVAPLQPHPSPNFLGCSSWRVSEPPRTPLPKGGLLKGTAGPGFGHWPGWLLAPELTPLAIARGQRALGFPHVPHQLPFRAPTHQRCHLAPSDSWKSSSQQPKPLEILLRAGYFLKASPRSANAAHRRKSARHAAPPAPGKAKSRLKTRLSNPSRSLPASFRPALAAFANQRCN